MISSRKKAFNDGFSLVEILVVMVILGVVITSVYNLYIHSKRTANTSEEVVDVQQNLRMALDTLVTDIRMAGFLVVNDKPAILSAPGLVELQNEDVFEIQSRASMKSFARVVKVDGYTLHVAPGMEVNFRKDDLVALFSPGPATFKKNSEGKFFKIIGDPTGDSTKGVLTLDSSVETIAQLNDIIVVKSNTEDDVAQILYSLSGNNLMRADDSGDSIIAGNITELNLDIKKNGTASISAIRIDITGQLDTPNGVKNRSLQTIVKLRNSFED